MPARMQHLQISLNTVSALSGVNPANLSQWLRGKTSMSFKMTQILNDRMEMIEALAQCAAPLPLDWHATEMILALGQKLRSKQLQIRITDSLSDSILGGVSALAGK